MITGHGWRRILVEHELGEGVNMCGRHWGLYVYKALQGSLNRRRITFVPWRTFVTIRFIVRLLLSIDQISWFYVPQHNSLTPPSPYIHPHTP